MCCPISSLSWDEHPVFCLPNQPGLGAGSSPRSELFFGLLSFFSLLSFVVCVLFFRAYFWFLFVGLLGARPLVVLRAGCLCFYSIVLIMHFLFFGNLIAGVLFLSLLV